MHYDEKVGNTKMAPPPEGKFLWGTIKLGNRGQIVIPKEARDKYGLQECLSYNWDKLEETQ